MISDLRRHLRFLLSFLLSFLRRIGFGFLLRVRSRFRGFRFCLFLRIGCGFRCRSFRRFSLRVCLRFRVSSGFRCRFLCFFRLRIRFGFRRCRRFRRRFFSLFLLLSLLCFQAFFFQLLQTLLFRGLLFL